MSSLTKRQVEFLVHAANGMDTSSIATECGVSRSTVRSTIEDARERTCSKTVGQTIIRAISYEAIVIDGDGTAQESRTYFHRKNPAK